jgi:hypothetical protein
MKILADDTLEDYNNVLRQLATKHQDLVFFACPRNITVEEFFRGRGR